EWSARMAAGGDPGGMAAALSGGGPRPGQPGWSTAPPPAPVAAPSNVPSGTVAASGEPRLTSVGNYRLGCDERRATLIQTAAEASKSLPPGWRVEAFSGQRGSGAPPHQTQAAVDFRLIDPQGRAVPDYQSPQHFAVYERFAQNTHLALEKLDPELAKQHR